MMATAETVPTPTPTPTPGVVTPLYGHVSEETAYLVKDYPYSFTLRCQIRYWLESHPKKGHRFVSQTENPKNGRWNAPKRSTYTAISAAMYLDDKGHVKWANFCDWKAPESLIFVQRFPGAAGIDTARVFVAMKVRYLDDTIAGRRWVTMSGVRCNYSDAQREADVAEVSVWREVAAVLGVV